jgi:predicted RNA binding protein YcfA (HicA-like mRNA interferase family)
VPKLKKVSGEETIRVLEKLGFQQVRQRGSHVVLKKQTSEKVIGCVVPLHTQGVSSWYSARYSETGRGEC